MKPILFKTDRVRAILGGRKSVTRRGPFQMKIYTVLKGLYRADKNRLCALFHRPDDYYAVKSVRAPYQPGDILYVRETWAAWSRTEGLAPKLYYKADRDAPDGIKWHPSIHMPKEAARLGCQSVGVGH